jgi:AraC-like DNA-binding protein
VRRLRSVWTSLDPTKNGRERRLPDASIVILVNLERDQLSYFDGPVLDSLHLLPGIAVALPRLHPIGLDRSDQRRLLGVELSPGAARTFLGVPPGSLGVSFVALEDLWGSAARSLCAQLQDCRDSTAAWRVLDTVLEGRAGAAPEPGLARALEQLRAGHRVAEVAARTGFSSSSFTRRVHAEAGLTPKQLHRLGRFGRALAADPGQEGGWATIAAATGYADQSHLGREFRQFTGLTPHEYRKAAPSAGRHVPA